MYKNGTPSIQQVICNTTRNPLFTNVALSICEGNLLLEKERQKKNGVNVVLQTFLSVSGEYFTTFNDHFSSFILSYSFARKKDSKTSKDNEKIGASWVVQAHATWVVSADTKEESIFSENFE